MDSWTVEAGNTTSYNNCGNCGSGFCSSLWSGGLVIEALVDLTVNQIGQIRRVEDGEKAQAGRDYLILEYIQGEDLAC